MLRVKGITRGVHLTAEVDAALDVIRKRNRWSLSGTILHFLEVHPDVKKEIKKTKVKEKLNG